MEHARLLEVLAEFGIEGAQRSLNSNKTEEVILLAEHDYLRIDLDAFSKALAATFPTKKTAVIMQSQHWRGEQI